jgi:outer membrane protein TolC
MKIQTTLFLWLLAAMGNGQPAQTLSIEDCYNLSKQNYPLVKQRELLMKSKEYTVDNLSKGYLPQVGIFGQASYQSAVTELPIKLPGVTVPSLSKDQYKLYAEVNQVLFDGGIVKQQKLSQEANAVVELQKIEVELYKLKERVNQLYFGILLADEQLKQTEILSKDIQSALKKAEAGLANGVAYKSNVDVLKAELLKVSQRVTEIRSNRKAFTDMLGLLIGQELNETTVLIKPSNPGVSTQLKRPELLTFEQQTKTLEIQSDLIRAKNMPKLNLFLQGGYGRPALNFLSNSFEPYYIGGIRLNWNLSGLYTFKKDKAILEISRSNIELQKELFRFNTGFTLKQQSVEVNKLQELLSGDDEIILLRTNVKQAASAQLQNGVISSSDYLRELNAEELARENKVMHEIQLLLAIYNQRTVSGE